MVEFAYAYDTCRKMSNKPPNCLASIERAVEPYSCDMQTTAAILCRRQCQILHDTKIPPVAGHWMRKQNRNRLILLFSQKALFAKKLQKFQCDIETLRSLTYIK